MRRRWVVNTAPSQIVQRQLDAYNSRDIEAFLSAFAEDAQATELGADAPSQKGKTELRSRYAELFANSPHLYSEVVTRTCFAHIVVDLERITGRNGSSEVYEVLAIYEVRGGLITRVYFGRNS
jgi:hypothetical protein